MAAGTSFQFRTTIFGQLVRLLSGNKLFQYPDEIDPSLWKRAIHQDSLEPPEAPATGADKAAQDGVDGVPHNALVQRDGGQDSILVDWYGPDDLEVRSSAAFSLPRLGTHVSHAQASL